MPEHVLGTQNTHFTLYYITLYYIIVYYILLYFIILFYFILYVYAVVLRSSLAMIPIFP